MRSSRRRTGVLFGCGAAIMSAVLLVSGCGKGAPSPVGDPDPHGQLMAQLRPTLSAIPSTVHTFGKQFVAPKWDSCDGVRSTFGWDEVTVIAEFDHVSSPSATVAAISESLHTMGWAEARTSGDGAWYWHRKLSTGSVATIQLLGGPGVEAPSPWGFQATVPAATHPVKGC